MRTIRAFLGLALPAAALLAGCGGEARDATSKELAALTAEVAKLRSEQTTIAERLAALERRKAPPPAAAASEKDAPPAPPAAQRPVDDDRPSLDVVRLGPSEDAADDVAGDVDADGPRTVLRSSASGIIVEETGPGGATRPVSDTFTSKKGAKRLDRADRKKTASVSAP